jgi:ribonuclease HI
MTLWIYGGRRRTDALARESASVTERQLPARLSMMDAAEIISATTGCTAAKAQRAVAELIAAGWTAPVIASAAEANPDPSTPTKSLPGLSAINNQEILVAHTDGACSGNPGPGGWAVVFSQNGEEFAEYSGSVTMSTNNQMELTAVREALKHAPSGVRLDIVTDSQNVIGWLAKGWKRNKSEIAALSSEIDALLNGLGCTAKAPDSLVQFRHVLGHQGDKFNERADKLATSAIKAAKNSSR